ncbi:putative hydroquinone glucosyltransferase-like [Sesbania bispinosa]|nr:putative hydroquinone glucosyltransferase-like [Sesbania bispinosa]
MENQNQQQKPPLVAMLPSPGMGHLIPMIEFAKRLVRHNDLTVTFVIPTDGPPSKAQTTVLTSLHVAFPTSSSPQVTLSDVPPGTKIEPIIYLTVLRSLPSLRQALLSLMETHRVTALVVDLFGTRRLRHCPLNSNSPPTSTSLPQPWSCPSAFTFTSSTRRFSVSTGTSLNRSTLPGCVPVHGKDLLDPVQDRNNDAYKCFLYHCKRYRPPVYPVGPLVNEDRVVKGDEACLKWLDEQPRGSVIFVCFGSGGTLSSAQMDEVAHGLEMSEQRFLWVVRCPNDKVANASFFIADSQTDPIGFLPEGVVNGVPLVAWPLYAEQKMNAVLLTEEVKVALRPKVGENGLVEREEIANVVRTLMESEDGKKLRYRMRELKEAAAAAMKENGSSTKQISELALKWKGQTTASN